MSSRWIVWSDLAGFFIKQVYSASVQGSQHSTNPPRHIIVTNSCISYLVHILVQYPSYQKQRIQIRTWRKRHELIVYQFFWGPPELLNHPQGRPCTQPIWSCFIRDEDPQPVTMLPIMG
ncbi:uncharacterized protein EURHEDRAFT_408300 [Aspergillus ruber CBS 135680]|uniref:Uncharacterized protein n=1 Tax=Aspergillus ruber (strain CBS 135680) TaxID=1388766 RepID=A0A017SQ49_ASPRC|nr:uncharacterized protein EURHEDRAFT_408300 [Aspergillus ruber CBS 135680]EYE99052.1 hypothetical protein EURHEDRAFT_408300 [Aspergillus ruber CBS 135680]